MASAPPLVSVVIPTYNRAELVQEAADSVLAQSYRPLELIVVDDGSTDTTAAALARRPALRTLRQEHTGMPGQVRNAGARLTENYAIHPAASVAGFYMAHPSARYFSVGRIGRDQLADYARRKRTAPDEAARWLGGIAD